MTADPAYAAALGVAASRPAIRIGARARRALVQRRGRCSSKSGCPGAADGTQFPLANADDSAGRTIGRPPRRRPLSLEHRRRGRAARSRPASCSCRRSASRPAPRVLMLVGALAIVPLAAGDAGANSGRPSGRSSLASAALVACGRCCRPATSSTGRWRARTTANGAHDARRADRGRRGHRAARRRTHGCSPTAIRCRRRTPLSQRYMRALAHIPLLAIESPEAVLVIGFGVGNTTHAATLHPSIRRVEVADLSTDILASRRLLQGTPTATCCATRAWRCTSTTAGSICRCSRRARTI